VADFTTALIATLPPARDRDAAFAYHAVLRGLPDGIASHAEGRLLDALIERSPLTALGALDRHMPAALEDLASTLLPGRTVGDGPVAWASADAWLAAVSALLDDHRLARWARHCWLALEETHAACRNTGLLLEALRRRGGHRDLLWAFYESYDYFRGAPRSGNGHRYGRVARTWPVLATIEKLLAVTGDDDLASEAALRANRRGSAYFLKFRPLLELVVDEGGLPAGYPQLTVGFVLALRRLVPYTTTAARQRISFEAVAFEDAAREA
jgi:hypothetical protein